MIRESPVPEALPFPRLVGPFWQARKGDFLFNLDGVVRFLVRDGGEIIFSRAPNALDGEVKQFLLTTGLNVILLQRGGTLPLHASSISTSRGAVLFAGFSGASKSTLLTEFLRRGHTMLRDDMAPLQMQDGQLVVWPVFPRLNLWADAARHFGKDTAHLARVRPQEEKFYVHINGPFPQNAVPVQAAYVLTTHNRPDVRLEVLSNPQKFNILLYRTAGAPFLKGLNLRQEHFELVSRFAPALALKRVRRPEDRMCVKEVADCIEADLAQMP